MNFSLPLAGKQLPAGIWQMASEGEDIGSTDTTDDISEHHGNYSIHTCGRGHAASCR